MMIKELKIYLSSGSVPVIPQMINFAKCAHDKNIIKVIGWFRNELSKQDLKGTQAIYYKQKYKVSPDFVTYILKLAEKFQPEKISIHVNVIFCNVELFPVISYLTRLVPKDKIEIHMYDDGMHGILERNKIHTLTSKEFIHQKKDHSKQLMLLLKHETNPFNPDHLKKWPMLMNYVWHEFFNTTYHLMNEHEMNSYGTSAFFNYISKNMVSLRHNDFLTLTNAQKTFCLSLLNISSNSLIELSNQIVRPNSLIYMGGGYFDKSKDDKSTELQISKIRQMKLNGIIKENDNIIFKAHPINHPDNQLKIKKELGEEVMTIPKEIPFEVLQMVGIPICEIICLFSTLIFTLSRNHFRHIIVDIEDKASISQTPYLQELLDNHYLDPKKISGWKN